MTSRSGSDSTHRRVPLKRVCCEAVAHFTDREVQVLVELASGHTNTQIASRLHLSAATIGHHVERMIKKSRAGSRTDLVARAIMAGIIAGDTWPPVPTGPGCLRFPD